MCLYELYVSTLNKVGSGSGLSKLLGESHRRRIQKDGREGKGFRCCLGGQEFIKFLAPLAILSRTT